MAFPKVAVLELAGQELDVPTEYELQAADVPVDGSGLPGNPGDTQEALENVSGTAGTSRYVVGLGKLGTINATQSEKFLQIFFGAASDKNPFPAPEPAEIVSLGANIKSQDTCTFSVKVNGTEVDTLVISNNTVATKKDLTHSLSIGDKISASLSDGSVQDPNLFVHVKVL